MSSANDKKARERHFVQIFQDLHPSFPEGQIIAGDRQERPDLLVVGPQFTIGIEVTSICHQKLKKEESENEQMVAAAREIYEALNLPNLQISVHFSSTPGFSRGNRARFARALAQLVAANIPLENCNAELENDWNAPESFPFEIHSIGIFRHKALSRNYWSVPSFGWVQENCANEIQARITEKEKRLVGYDPKCSEIWLLVVAENSSAAGAFDPSEITLSQQYTSSFDLVFFLDPSRRRLVQLKSVRRHPVSMAPGGR